MSLLSIRGLSKTYGGVAALRDASLEVDAGEVHALMGENGAGKSTLIKILAGAVSADAGEFAVNGRPVSISSTRDAYRLGLRFLHQELNVLPRRSVAENLFLGHSYPTRFAGLIDRRALHERARAALDGLGVTESRQRPLLVGCRPAIRWSSRSLQRSSRIASGSGRLFVMDEPTAALSSEEAARLFRIIAELKRARPRNPLCLAPNRRGAEDQRSHHGDARWNERRRRSRQAEATRAMLIDRMTGRANLGTAAIAARRSCAAIHRAGRAGNDGERAHGRILRSPRG